jgi:hypothetical protein
MAELVHDGNDYARQSMERRIKGREVGTMNVSNQLEYRTQDVQILVL